MHLIELVPRDLDATINEASEILSRYPSVKGFNIPDILRLEHRSYDVVAQLLKNGIFSIPHIRTADLPLDDTVSIISTLIDLGLTHVLLVSGDVHKDRASSGVTPVMLTVELKQRFPNLHVYGALDPYRQSKEAELCYMTQKMEAGMSGLFSQPFFEYELAADYLDALSHTDIFLGASPVLTEKSRQYWTDVNNVTFPESFEFSLDYNIRLAKMLIKVADDHGQHTYHMPIRMSGLEYAEHVF